MLFMDMYICSKSIKTKIGMINKKFNIMIISSLGRKGGNEIKMGTKKGTFNSICIVLFLKKRNLGTSLAVQWLGLGALTDRALGSIPGWGTKIPKAMRHSQKKKKKKKKERKSEANIAKY